MAQNSLSITPLFGTITITINEPLQQDLGRERFETSDALSQPLSLQELFSRDYSLYLAVQKQLRNFLSHYRKALLEDTILRIKKATQRDIFIIQTIQSIDEITKSLNLLTKRFYEWLGYILPELLEEKKGKALLEGVAQLRRDELLKSLRLFEEESMGMLVEEHDWQALQRFASYLLSLYEAKEQQLAYLEQLMTELCPHVHVLAGTTIGARLIALIGSLEKLAKAPASKIQLLGAEKALFRHLTTGAKSPKYGILHEHPLVMQAKQNDKGKVARALADKLAIAAKLDYFKGAYQADRLKKQLEERFGEW